MVRPTQGQDKRLHRALQVQPPWLCRDSVLWQLGRRAVHTLHLSPRARGCGLGEHTIPARAQRERAADGQESKAKDPDRPAPAVEPRPPSICYLTCFASALPVLWVRMFTATVGGPNPHQGTPAPFGSAASQLVHECPYRGRQLDRCALSNFSISRQGCFHPSSLASANRLRVLWVLVVYCECDFIVNICKAFLF